VLHPEGDSQVRTRLLNPEFFKDEKLGNLSYEARLAFAGLWCASDRTGRFQWRPRRLRTDIFPYDSLDLSKIMDELESGGLIISYETMDCGKCGYIPNFLKYQTPHKRESKSILPEPKGLPVANLDRAEDGPRPPVSVSVSVLESVSVKENKRNSLTQKIHEIISTKHGTKILATAWDWTPLDRLEIPDKWVLDLYDAVFNSSSPGWIQKYIGWLEGENAAKNIINH